MNIAQAQVMQWLSSRTTGAITRDVAFALRIEMDAAKRRLMALKRGGHVMRIGPQRGPLGRWCTTEHAAETSALMTRTLLETARYQERQRYRRKVERIKHGADYDNVRPFVHRVVPAGECMPLGKVGLSCVWELA